MPRYKYLSKDMGNNKRRGFMYADSKDDLSTKLFANGLYLVSFSIDNDTLFEYKLTTKQLSDFCRALGNLVLSGTSLTRGIDIMANQESNQNIQKILIQISIFIKQGNTLSSAMTLCKKSFPIMLINMIYSAEQSGKLGQTSLKMSEYYRKEYKLNSKTKSALIYPKILIVITVAVVLIIFTVVLPVFFEMFEGQKLPWVTQLMLDISLFITNNVMTLMVIAGVVAVLITYLLSLKEVQYKMDKFKLKLPLFNKLFKITYSARFASTLSSLYSAGVSMVDALELCAKVIGNHYVSQQLEDLTFDVKSGKLLSASIKKVKGFDLQLPAFILIGEESGEMDKLLESLSDNYEYDVEMTADNMIKIIEPAMIVVLAIIIGTIMISVLLPLLQMYETIG